MDYKPAFLLRNGHFNTIYPSLFRKQTTPAYHREEILTSDQDFLHTDTLQNGHSRLAILCHGLEGSSNSQYMMATASLLSKHNWDVVCMNYRFCSGTINKQKRMYHSGATDDLSTVIEHYKKAYEELALVGFSLGGNLVLKYAGENSGQRDLINQIVAVSVPVDLMAGCINICRPSNYIYHINFLKSLTAKVKQKYAQYPKDIDLGLLKKVKTLYDFDDLFTAPIHGFVDAKDYYTQCSSKQLLKDIDKRTLIINALDDPFLPEECYPYKEVGNNPNIELLTPAYGGHVGFVLRGQKYFWIEQRIASFLNKKSEFHN